MSSSVELEQSDLDLGHRPGLEVIKIEYSLRLKIKRNDWLLADTCYHREFLVTAGSVNPRPYYHP